MDPARRALGPARAFVPAAAALLLLVLHAGLLRREALWEMEYRRWVDGQVYSAASWRYWEDMKFAIGRYFDAALGPQRGRQARLEQVRLQGMVTSQPELTAAFREVLERETERLGIQPHQFWRTIPDRPLLRRRMPYQVPVLEDPGRAMLGAAAFRVLGGASPYFFLWAAALLALPQLLWLWLELRAAGHGAAGALLLFLLAMWPYLIETLTLAHSAVGFYMVAVLLAATLAVYGALGRSRSRGMFWARVAAASLVLAVCTLCRSGSILVAPALGLALFLAVRRVYGASPRRMGACVLLAAAAWAALLLPYLAVRPSERHAMWLGFWEGLGDYGGARGYSWHDRDAKRFLARRGLEPFQHPNEVQPSHEEFFRREFLAGVRREPLWYAGVLARRAIATVTQSRLWPMKRWHGRPVSEPVFHYKYVTPADWFGFAGRALELPLLLLWIPLGVVLVRGPRPRLTVLGLCALATLPIPVLVSTAAGIETQAFALVYLVAGAMVVQDLAAQRPRSCTTRPPTIV